MGLCRVLSWLVAATLAAAACVTFRSGSTDDGADASADGSGSTPGACAESCEAGDLECRFDDFDGGCGDWSVSVPDYDLQHGAIGRCDGGDVYVHAADTFDVTASLSITTPSRPYSAHVSAKIGVSDWDDAPVLAVEIGNRVATWIGVTEGLDGVSMGYHLCGPELPDGGLGACDAHEFKARKGDPPHEFVIDLTPSSTTLTFDCGDKTSVPAAPLPPGVDFDVVFGHIDGNPIDGTLDDVLVQFR